MAFFVTIRDSGNRRTIFAAGPFNRHGDAENCVGTVRRYIADAFPNDLDATWASYGTAQVRYAPMPVGRFNEALGLPAGRISELSLAPNRWWIPGEAPDLPYRAPHRPRRRAA